MKYIWKIKCLLKFHIFQTVKFQVVPRLVSRFIAITAQIQWEVIRKFILAGFRKDETFVTRDFGTAGFWRTRFCRHTSSVKCRKCFLFLFWMTAITWCILYEKLNCPKIFAAMQCTSNSIILPNAWELRRIFQAQYLTSALSF